MSIDRDSLPPTMAQQFITSQKMMSMSYSPITPEIGQSTLTPEIGLAGAGFPENKVGPAGKFFGKIKGFASSIKNSILGS